MSVIYIVFPLALLVAAVAVIAFIWATRSGQFDDMDTPAVRMLHDDQPADGSRPAGTAYLVSTSDRARNVRARWYPLVQQTHGGRFHIELVAGESIIEWATLSFRIPTK